LTEALISVDKRTNTCKRTDAVKKEKRILKRQMWTKGHKWTKGLIQRETFDPDIYVPKDKSRPKEEKTFDPDIKRQLDMR
jgi:uncharacterized membrane protein